MDQGNALSKLLAMEGVGYGTIRLYRIVSGSENQELEAMARGVVTQRYRRESEQASCVDLPGRLRSWGYHFVPPVPISLGLEHAEAGGNIPRFP